MISETYTLLIQRLHRKRRVRRTGVSSTTSTSRSEEVRRTGGQVCNDVEAIEPYGALLQRGISRTAARPKGLKRLKGILANRLPPVIEIIPLSGYLTHCAHLALTLNKFGCTRHSQGESQEGYTILYKFHLVFCARLLNFDRVQVRRRFGKMQTSLLFRSPCTNF